jgi:hypothetical protein
MRLYGGKRGPKRPDYDLRKKGNENDAEENGFKTISPKNCSHSVHRMAVNGAEGVDERPPAKAARIDLSSSASIHEAPQCDRGHTGSVTVNGAVERGSPQVSCSVLHRENGAIVGSDRRVGRAIGADTAADCEGLVVLENNHSVGLQMFRIP